MSTPTDDEIIARTRHWLERAVIGLNLCPFAKAAYVKDRVRLVVSAAQSSAALEQDLADALQELHAADPAQCETTVLVHPWVLGRFRDYNDFLDTADALVLQLGLEGVLQVASFHPRYQFAGTAPDDIENHSNRSPYPLLHLLREASVAQAVDSYPDVDDIPARNIDTLRRLGHEGLARWMAAEEPRQDT